MGEAGIIIIEHTSVLGARTAVWEDVVHFSELFVGSVSNRSSRRLVKFIRTPDGFRSIILIHSCRWWW